MSNAASVINFEQQHHRHLIIVSIHLCVKHAVRDAVCRRDSSAAAEARFSSLILT